MRLQFRIFLTSLAVTTAVTATLIGQAPSAHPRKPPAATSTKPWTAPRTPWGDPDISGNISNVFEASTPFERPDEFIGRRRDDVRGEELAAFRAQLQKRSIDNFEGP